MLEGHLTAWPSPPWLAQHWAPTCQCWDLIPPGHFLPGCPHHTRSQHGTAAWTPPPCSPGVGLTVETCPAGAARLEPSWPWVWQSPRRWAAASPSGGKRVGAVHRRVAPHRCPAPCCAHRARVPATSLGQSIPIPGSEQREAVGLSIGFRSKITTDHGNLLTGLGKDPRARAHILNGDGSQHSHAALPSAAVKWVQAAPLARWLLGAAARFHFSGLRPAWMSLIAQRSASSSPGPRVGGTPGRNLTRTRVIQDQRWGPGNCNGHKPKYTACPPR